MDEAENKTESGETGAAVKQAANQLKDEAQKAAAEIKGRGIMGFFSFEHLYFPVVARYVFIILCVLSVIGMVFGVIGGLIAIISTGVGAGIGMMLAAVIGGVFGLIFLRLWFEMVVVGFSINDNLKAIRNNMK